jgi:hypothetical protein
MIKRKKNVRVNEDIHFLNPLLRDMPAQWVSSHGRFMPHQRANIYEMLLNRLALACFGTLPLADEILWGEWHRFPCAWIVQENKTSVGNISSPMDDKLISCTLFEEKTSLVRRRYATEPES